MGLGLQDLLPGPESSRLGSHAARSLGGRLLVPKPREVARKPQKGRAWRSNQGAGHGKPKCRRSGRAGQGSGHRCIGDPAKLLHCSWGLGGPVLLGNLPASEGQLPSPSHRGRLSFPWAGLRLILEGPGAVSREGTMLGPALFSLLPPDPQG